MHTAWDNFLTLSACGFHLSSWDIGEWSECSKTCGLGMQHRQVLCRQIYANRTLNVHTSRCRDLERPEIASTCQLKICSEWQIRTEWTAVSGSCHSQCDCIAPGLSPQLVSDVIIHDSHTAQDEGQQSVLCMFQHHQYILFFLLLLLEECCNVFF